MKLGPRLVSGPYGTAFKVNYDVLEDESELVDSVTGLNSGKN